MDDRTMLELAAKIMGLDSVMEMYGRSEDGSIFCDANDPPTEWNSLQDDGDALRLAVKLKLCFGPNFDGDLAVCFGDNGRNITEAFGADHYAATRRAITRAAAEIQLAKENGK